MLLVLRALLCFLVFLWRNACVLSHSNSDYNINDFDSFDTDIDNKTNIYCEEELSFGIAMTTIPPRYATLHHTIESWIYRQLCLPRILVIFVPHKYKRFQLTQKAKRANKDITNAKLLSGYLGSLLQGKNVYIIETKYDFGPMTKYVALFEFVQNNQFHTLIYEVTHWIVCDDDVNYSENVISGYTQHLQSISKPLQSDAYLDLMPIFEAGESGEDQILTYYRRDIRFNVVNGNGLNRPLVHIQGVDTVLFSKNVIMTHKGFKLGLVESFVVWMHKLCPNSFYQDDYLISLIVYASTVPVFSLWNGNSVARHVEGVSKHGNQLHMRDQVFFRESSTQQCIMDYIDQIMTQLL